MTRDMICLTRQDGRPCEFRTEVNGARACARLTCCSNPDLPAPVEYERRLAHPAATCPHPDGNQWAGCTVEPMPVGVPAAIDPRVAMLTARARCCKGDGTAVGEAADVCPAHAGAGAWPCHDLRSNDIRTQVKDPAFDCPRGCFKAVVSG